MRHPTPLSLAKVALLALIMLLLLSAVLIVWPRVFRTQFAAPTALAGNTATATATPTTSATARPAAATASAAPPTATPSAPPTPIQPPPLRSAGSVILGYYVPYDPRSWDSLQKNAGAIDYVAAHWLEVDACGNLGSRDDLTIRRFAREQGITVLPSLLTHSYWLNHRLLTDPTTTEHLIDQIVAYVVEEQVEGFDVDLEAIEPGDRDAYSQFVARLGAALHAQGKIMTVAVPAKTSDVRDGWAGAFDYAAIGKHADYVQIMAYDFHWPGGEAGPIAPYGWVDQVVSFAASQMPTEKILLGNALYGYDWNLSQGGRAKAWIYPQVAALAEQYGARITYDPVSRASTFQYTTPPDQPGRPLPTVPGTDDHEFVSRTLPACGVSEPGVPTPTPPPPAQDPAPAPPTPEPEPTPVPGQLHEVWLENADSVAAKLEIARNHRLAGMFVWRLGQEDSAIWPHLAAYSNPE